MLENTQYHQIDNFDQERMQKMLENILNDDLKLKTRSVRLGRRIIKINYYNPRIAYNLQKDNKIIILEDPNKTCHVNFQGELEPEQISNVWDHLMINLSSVMTTSHQENIILTRDEIVYEIIEKMGSLHIEVDAFEILKHLEEFRKQHQRLPYKHEINHIINSLMKIQKNEQIESINETKSKRFTVNSNISMTPRIQEPQVKNLPTSTFTETTGTILTIPKPIGRRTCPHCGNIATYKIFENIDKSYILCAFPRLYGKKYHCDGCRGIWREK